MRGIVALAAALALGPAAAAGPAHEHGHHYADHDHDGPAVRAAAPTLTPPQLEDVTRSSGPQRIAWSTYWRQCWETMPGARHYELRRLTSEGAPQRPERVDGNCYRVEAAAGENPVAAGLPKRELMLAMQAAQSAIQVRAVLADGSFSAWSAARPVGEIAGH